MRNFRTYFMVLVLTTFCWAGEMVRPRTAPVTPRQGDRVTMTMFNINNIAGWISYDGFHGHTPDDKQGTFFPRGTAHVVFTEGFLLGGYVRDNIQQNPRVGGVTYLTGLTPGWIITPGTDGAVSAIAVDPADPQVMIYRIRRDWQSLIDHQGNFSSAIRSDAAELNQIEIDAVSDAQMLQVYNDYQYAWENWPADLGAPYDDLNNNGQWDTRIDEPGLANADQVIWYVVNDLNEQTTRYLYGSDPFGLEIQTTLWGYNKTGPIGDLYFLRRRLINKSGVNIDSLFIALWSDTDLGAYTDDLAGCDTVLDLTYTYNGFAQDGKFAEYNIGPPAFGYALLQGPLAPANGQTAMFDMGKRSDYKNLKMSSVYMHASGGSISDPPLGDYEGTIEWYLMLNGFLPTRDLENPIPWQIGAGPDLGKNTKYRLSGNPLSGQGDVDGLQFNLPPGDRRFSSHSGPFNMAPGDTQEVIYALVGGKGSNNLSSVGVLKYHVSIANYLQHTSYKISSSAPTPTLTASAQSQAIIIDWGSLPAQPESLENTLLTGDYKFEGYNLWQLPSPEAELTDGERIATFDKTTPPAAIKGPYYDDESGLVLDRVLIYGNNHGIERHFVVDRDYINESSLIDGKTYTYALTVYYYNSAPGNPFPVRESVPATIQITAQQTNPGFTATYGDSVLINHLSGKATGSIQARVVNPGNLTGHTYHITYHDPIVDSWGDTLGYGDYWLITDLTSGEIEYDSRNGVSDPIVDGIQIEEDMDRSGGLVDWDYDGNRWISGVNWGGSQFFGGLDIGSNFFGSRLGLEDLVSVRLEFQDQAAVNANGYISKGAVYRRDLGYDYAGTGELPIAAYDIDDPDIPRRINICFVEDENASVANGSTANLIWDMAWNGTEFAIDGGREYFFIMNSDYDEGAPYDAINDGTSADVLYVIWPQQRGTRAYLLAPFTMTIFATHAVTTDDLFEFVAPGTPDIPNRFRVFQNYPNPFNNMTTFRFWVPQSERVLLEIYNILGQRLATLVDGVQEQGEYFRTWNAGGLSSGMYFYRLRVGNEEALKKIVLVK